MIHVTAVDTIERFSSQSYGKMRGHYSMIDDLGTMSSILSTQVVGVDYPLGLSKFAPVGTPSTQVSGEDIQKGCLVSKGEST